MNLLDRHVPAAGRPRAARIRCNESGCTGTVHHLQPGEQLFRRAGTTTQTREATCDDCGTAQTIRVRTLVK